MTGVYQALKRGRRLLLITPLSIVALLTTGTAAFFYVKDISSGKYVLFIFLAILLGSALAWIWWSYWVVKWKLWAYAEVKDFHLLYRRAVNGKLVWPMGSVYEKTEFRSGDDARRIDELEDRLEEPRQRESIVDDRIPETYTIGINSWGLYFGSACAVAMVIFGIFAQSLIPVFCLLVFTVLTLWSYYEHRKHGSTFMHIDEQTLVVNGREIPWSVVRKFDAIQTGAGKDQETLLHIWTSPDGPGYLQVNINRGNISRRKLEYILDVYHSRFLDQKAN